MQEIHVNLVDLVASYGREIELFDDLMALRVYSRKTGKYFPRKAPQASGVLQSLYRVLRGYVDDDPKEDEQILLKLVADLFAMVSC
jgi:hypothetical protein